MQINPKFHQILKILAKDQTKYLRPNHFWKQTNSYNLGSKRPSSNLVLLLNDINNDIRP